MKANDPLGQVLRDGDTIGLRNDRELAHPPERVWRAITESDQLRHWLPTDIAGERHEGAPLQLPFWPPLVAKYGIEDDTMTGRILTWDPLVALLDTGDPCLIADDGTDVQRLSTDGAADALPRWSPDGTLRARPAHSPKVLAMSSGTAGRPTERRSCSPAPEPKRPRMATSG